ncbi:hypothetical protein ZWY2020_032373 [Hordeum vulgare]|nr:hypothetical protein ZWY2020_032373 [Hordeum vulgare]
MVSAAASPPPVWVILGSVPRVLSAAAAAAALSLGPGAADFSLALPAPPRVALLTIPPRIFPCRPTRASFPCVLAADPSAGLLLIHADQGRATGPTVIDKPGYRQFGWLPFLAGYFVLDAAAGSALPLPTPELVAYKGDLGLIAYPDGDGYMVAELQPILSGNTADLLRFSSKVGEWVRESVAYPLPARNPSSDGVVYCYGMLWWVDLSCCLVTCDPFSDDPVLTRVKLPGGKALKFREASGLLHKYRCVGVSAGKLRFVDMYRNRSSNGAAQISVWTLADYPPYSTDWTLEYEATFAEICNDARPPVCRGRSPCSRSSIPPTPTWSTSSWTSTGSASTCVLARSSGARSTSWLMSRRAKTLLPASFTPGSCHRISLSAQVCANSTACSR